MAKPKPKKRQHIIPECYTKAWCDPASFGSLNPYIWRISKDGESKRKRSPKKSFVEKDRYTINCGDGKRELIVEDTLAQIESDFVRVLEKVRLKSVLSDMDRVILCAFTAAMHSRTVVQGDHWAGQFGELHEMVKAMEEQHNSPPRTSRQTKVVADHAQQVVIGMSLNMVPKMLFDMSMVIFETNDTLGFITSDAPCVWFNPEAHKLPPFYRSPGLAQKDIEVSLPLTPQHLLCFSHHPFVGYREAPEALVDEFNKRTRFHCTDEFVSWKGETKPIWFDPGEEPEDSWEKSGEGKRTLAQKEEWERIQAEWEEEQKKKS